MTQRPQQRKNKGLTNTKSIKNIYAVKNLILSDKPSKSVIKFANVADVHMRRLKMTQNYHSTAITGHTNTCTNQTKKRLMTAFCYVRSVTAPYIQPRKICKGSKNEKTVHIYMYGLFSVQATRRIRVAAKLQKILFL